MKEAIAQRVHQQFLCKTIDKLSMLCKEEVAFLKKPLIIASICGISLLTGCQYDDQAGEKLYHKNGTTINVTERNEMFNQNRAYNGTQETMNNFGFVRHQKSPVYNDINNDVYNVPGFNREQMADMISKLSVQLQNVDDAATLVTDEEVLIVYRTNSSDRLQVADQVKKSALSVVPRYFHVYVSDNPRMFQDVERFGYLDGNRQDIDQILDATINDMLNAPQGRKLSNGENENGEWIGEVNDHLDDDKNDGSMKMKYNGIKEQNNQSIDQSEFNPAENDERFDRINK